MVGEIHHRGGVGLCSEGEFEFILVGPDITGDDLEVARISHLSVRGEVHEFHGIAVDAGIPNLILEAFRTPVQMVGAIVDR